MITSFSDKIRRVASLIERDSTPSDDGVGGHIMLNKRDFDKEDPIKKKIVQEAPLKPTAPSQQRRPRRQPGHKNKWNSDTKSGLMREYMQEYRAEGKDKEVDGPKSTYKKKL